MQLKWSVEHAYARCLTLPLDAGTVGVPGAGGAHLLLGP
jgi:hypothetical protein